MVLAKEECEGLVQLGQNIRRIRTDAELSLQQLATLADVEKAQIYRIEYGKVNVKMATILKLAKALNVSPKEFFG